MTMSNWTVVRDHPDHGTSYTPPPIDRVEVAVVEIRGGWQFVVRSYARSELCGTDNAENLQEVLDICGRLGVVPELLLVPLESDPIRIFIVEAPQASP